MKKIMLMTVLLGYLAMPAARADESKDDAAIHSRSDEWNAAWNKHDAKLMTAFFLKDGDVINPFGRRAHGQAEIEALFTEEQSGVMAGTTYTSTIDSIHYIGKTVAIVDVSGEITGMKTPDGSAVPPFKHHVTWIAQKKSGKWMAVGVRAYMLQPPNSK